MKQGQMSRMLVYFCIAVLTIVAAWAMIVKLKFGYDLSDVLTFVAAVFGGELLMLCLKRIFAAPRDDMNDYDNNEEDDNHA